MLLILSFTLNHFAYAEMSKFDLAQNELEILRELGSDEVQEREELIEKMKKE